MSVPELRFKAEGGRDFPKWKDMKISELNLYISDGNYGEQYPTSAQMVTSGVPFIRANNIKEQKLVWDEMKFITPVHHKILTSGHLLPNDILITTRGEIGAVALVQDEFGGSNINAQICLLRVKETNQLAPEFLIQGLTTIYCQKQFKELQTGSALKQLPKSSLGKVSIKFPCLIEQTKIANFLMAVDEKILMLTRKQNLLAQYKKGVMQQIFSQGLRFKDDDGQDFPEWNKTSLGEIGKFKSGTGFTDSEQGGTSGIPFYKVSDMNLTENKLEMLVANNYVSEDQINKMNFKVISDAAIVFAKVGAAIFLERKRKAKNFLIDNNMMAFIPTCEINFIKHFMDSIRLSKFAQVGALPSYNASDLSIIEIALPCNNEQTKIANFLTAVDDKITITQAKLKAVKQYKQSLLHQMFV